MVIEPPSMPIQNVQTPIQPQQPQNDDNENGAAVAPSGPFFQVDDPRA